MRDSAPVSETWLTAGDIPTLPLMVAAQPPPSRTRIRVEPMLAHDDTAIWDLDTILYKPPRRAILAPLEVEDATMRSAPAPTRLRLFYLQARCRLTAWLERLARRFA